MHDKSRGMVKETQRTRFIEEKKEMEHELTECKLMIKKFMNDHYVYHSTQKRHGGYLVKFQDPADHHLEKLNIQYESNLKTLETLWHPE